MNDYVSSTEYFVHYKIYNKFLWLTLIFLLFLYNVYILIIETLQSLIDFYCNSPSKIMSRGHIPFFKYIKGLLFWTFKVNFPIIPCLKSCEKFRKNLFECLWLSWSHTHKRKWFSSSPKLKDIAPLDGPPKNYCHHDHSCCHRILTSYVVVVTMKSWRQPKWLKRLSS